MLCCLVILTCYTTRYVTCCIRKCYIHSYIACYITCYLTRYITCYVDWLNGAETDQGQLQVTVLFAALQHVI